MDYDVDAIMENNLSENTKNIYKGRIKHFIAFVREHHIEFYNDQTESVDLNVIPENIIYAFLAHSMKKRRRNGDLVQPEEYRSYEHLNQILL